MVVLYIVLISLLVFIIAFILSYCDYQIRGDPLNPLNYVQKGKIEKEYN